MAEPPTRPLGRTGRTVAPVIRNLAGSPAPRPARPGDWCLLPCDAEITFTLPESVHLILGARSTDLESRRSTFIQDRLARLGRTRCDAVLLQEVSTGQVKAGGPFHRLSRLRDQGLLDLYFIEAASHEQAEWLLENSPAHALSIPFDLDDMTCAYRLLDAAAELGTGLLARRSPRPAWPGAADATPADHLRFVLGEPRISAAIVPVGEVADPALWNAGSSTPPTDSAIHPMPPDERQQWWESFCAAVPEPPKPKRGSPPDL